MVIRSNFNNGEIIQELTLLTALGLYFVAFSKEKVDDDRVKAIRGKALQGGFGVLVAMMISLSFIAIIKPSFLFSGANELSVIALGGLISYLLIFNIGLYFDNSRVSNSDTVAVNMTKNKLFFAAYFFRPGACGAFYPDMRNKIRVERSKLNIARNGCWKMLYLFDPSRTRIDFAWT